MGLGDLALQDGELVAQRKNFDVLVHIALRQQSDEGEHARERQVGQSQQHDGIILAYAVSRRSAASRTGRSQPMDGIFGTHRDEAFDVVRRNDDPRAPDTATADDAGGRFSR
ncbi:hypothetical protein [Dactylosporangium cerinum]